MKCNECKCSNVSEFFTSDGIEGRGPFEQWTCELMSGGSNNVDPDDECHFEKWRRWFEKMNHQFNYFERQRDVYNKGYGKVSELESSQKWVKKSVGWV
jgi:hypothetical protein